jgi:hypothetical protein
MGKILFTNVMPAITEGVMRERKQSALGRGLPFVRESPIRPGSVLAVVGGGPSINHHADEIKAHTDIWAINGAWFWAKWRGIDATFFSLCADGGWSRIFKEPVTGRAIIAPWCEPYLFDMWSGDVQVVPDAMLKTGPTTATGAWILAPKCGYAKVVFYGCESSFEDDTHAYDFYEDGASDRLVIRANGRDYNTTPQFLLQAEYMAEVIRTFPDVYSAVGGGLLGALIEDPDYDLVAASRRIAESLKV